MISRAEKTTAQTVSEFERLGRSALGLEVDTARIDAAYAQTARMIEAQVADDEWLVIEPLPCDDDGLPSLQVGAGLRVQHEVDLFDSTHTGCEVDQPCKRDCDELQTVADVTELQRAHFSKWVRSRVSEITQ